MVVLFIRRIFLGEIKVSEKVSVIMPVYNNGKYLKECLESVINQTYKNLEIIIIDDKSSDNSLEVISRFNDKRIKIIKLRKNSGVAIARNKGVEIATGEYICFIDSDDFWDLDKIKKQVEFMKQNDYTFIYGDYVYVKDGKIKRVCVPKSINYKEALKNTTIFTSTVMLSMEHLDKKDIYMPNIRRGQDTATWWNLLRIGIRAYAINEVLAFYRVGNKGSLSHGKFRALRRTWNIYKTQDLNLPQRMYYFSHYLKNAIARRIKAK